MDKEEAGVRAQSGERPEGGYYTNSERITLQKFSLGRITTLPNSIFGGPIRGGGRALPPGGGEGGTGRGGAIVVSPQNTLIDRAQNLQIQTTQQSVGTLQQLLEQINVRVVDLNTSINNLANQLRIEGQVEQTNLKNEQESERRLRENKVRLGRESELERGIVAAIARPIVMLQKKITSIFERITGALTTLFVGWLTNQGIETLKAITSGNTKKLEEIKNNVIKNILFTVGAFAAIKIGFSLLMRTITGLTMRVATFATKLALAPFRMAGSLIGKVLGFGGAASRAAPQTARAARPLITGSTNMMSKMFNGIKAFKPFGRGAATLGSRALGALPIIGTGLDIGFSINEALKGNWAGAGLYGGAAVTSLIPGGQPWALGLSLAGAGQSLMFDSSQKQQEAPSTPKAQPQAPAITTPPASTPKAQPQAPAITTTPPASAAPSPAPAAPIAASAAAAPQISMMPQTSELTRSSPEPSQEETKFETIDMSKLNVDVSQAYKSPSLLPSIQMEGQPSQTPEITPLPEPKPNVIISNGGKNMTQVSSDGQQQSLTDVPLIPSSNPDNFYVLYSQLNYNVVM